MPRGEVGMGRASRGAATFLSADAPLTERRGRRRMARRTQHALALGRPADRLPPTMCTPSQDDPVRSCAMDLAGARSHVLNHECYPCPDCAPYYAIRNPDGQGLLQRVTSKTLSEP